MIKNYLFYTNAKRLDKQAFLSTNTIADFSTFHNFSFSINGAYAIYDNKLVAWIPQSQNLYDDNLEFLSSLPISFTNFGSKKIGKICCNAEVVHAITEDFLVFSWGKDSKSQGLLALGEVFEVKAPTLNNNLSSLGVIAISLSEKHGAVIDSCRNLFTWGNGLNGQLGNQSTEIVLKPRKVILKEPFAVTKVECGNNCTCGITIDKVAFYFGRIDSSGFCNSNEYSKNDITFIPLCAYKIDAENIFSGDKILAITSSTGGLFLYKETQSLFRVKIPHKINQVKFIGDTFYAITPSNEIIYEFINYSQKAFTFDINDYVENSYRVNKRCKLKMLQSPSFVKVLFFILHCSLDEKEKYSSNQAKVFIKNRHQASLNEGVSNNQTISCIETKVNDYNSLSSFYPQKNQRRVNKISTMLGSLLDKKIDRIVTNNKSISSYKDDSCNLFLYGKKRVELIRIDTNYLDNINESYDPYQLGIESEGHHENRRLREDLRARTDGNVEGVKNEEVLRRKMKEDKLFADWYSLNTEGRAHNHTYRFMSTTGQNETTTGITSRNKFLKLLPNSNRVRSQYHMNSTYHNRLHYLNNQENSLELPNPQENKKRESYSIPSNELNKMKPPSRLLNYPHHPIDDNNIQEKEVKEHKIQSIDENAGQVNSKKETESQPEQKKQCMNKNDIKREEDHIIKSKIEMNENRSELAEKKSKDSSMNKERKQIKVNEREEYDIAEKEEETNSIKAKEENSNQTKYKECNIETKSNLITEKQNSVDNDDTKDKTNVKGKAKEKNEEGIVIGNRDLNKEVNIRKEDDNVKSEGKEDAQSQEKSSLKEDTEIFTVKYNEESDDKSVKGSIDNPLITNHKNKGENGMGIIEHSSTQNEEENQNNDKTNPLTDNISERRIQLNKYPKRKTPEEVAKEVHPFCNCDKKKSKEQPSNKKSIILTPVEHITEQNKHQYSPLKLINSVETIEKREATPQLITKDPAKTKLKTKKKPKGKKANFPVDNEGVLSQKTPNEKSINQEQSLENTQQEDKMERHTQSSNLALGIAINDFLSNLPQIKEMNMCLNQSIYLKGIERGSEDGKSKENKKTVETKDYPSPNRNNIENGMGVNEENRQSYLNENRQSEVVVEERRIDNWNYNTIYSHMQSNMKDENNRTNNNDQSNRKIEPEKEKSRKSSITIDITNNNPISLSEEPNNTKEENYKLDSSAMGILGDTKEERRKDLKISSEEQLPDQQMSREGRKIENKKQTKDLKTKQSIKEEKKEAIYSIDNELSALEEKDKVNTLIKSSSQLKNEQNEIQKGIDLNSHLKDSSIHNKNNQEITISNKHENNQTIQKDNLLSKKEDESHIQQITNENKNIIEGTNQSSELVADNNSVNERIEEIDGKQTNDCLSEHTKPKTKRMDKDKNDFFINEEKGLKREGYSDTPESKSISSKIRNNEVIPSAEEKESNYPKLHNSSNQEKNNTKDIVNRSDKQEDQERHYFHELFTKSDENIKTQLKLSEEDDKNQVTKEISNLFINEDNNITPFKSNPRPFNDFISHQEETVIKGNEKLLNQIQIKREELNEMYPYSSNENEEKEIPDLPLVQPILSKDSQDEKEEEKDIYLPKQTEDNQKNQTKQEGLNESYQRSGSIIEGEEKDLHTKDLLHDETEVISFEKANQIIKAHAEERNTGSSLIKPTQIKEGSQVPLEGTTPEVLSDKTKVRKEDKTLLSFGDGVSVVLENKVLIPLSSYTKKVELSDTALGHIDNKSQLQFEENSQVTLEDKNKALLMENSDVPLMDNTQENKNQAPLKNKSQIPLNDNSQLTLENKSQKTLADETQVPLKVNSQVAFNDNSQVALKEKNREKLENKTQVPLKDENQVLVKDKNQVLVKDKTQKTFETKSQEISENKTEITIKDITQVPVEHKTQETFKNMSQAITKDETQVPLKNNSQVLTEDKIQEIFKNKSQVPLKNWTGVTIRGITQEPVEDKTHETLENKSQMPVEDQTQETIKDKTQVALENKTQETYTNKSQETKKVNIQVAVEDQTQETYTTKNQMRVEDKTQVAMKGITQVTLENKAQLSSKDNSQLSIENKAQAPLKDDTKVSVEDKSKVLLKENSQLPIEDKTKVPLENQSQVPLKDKTTVTLENKTQEDRRSQLIKDVLKEEPNYDDYCYKQILDDQENRSKLHEVENIINKDNNAKSNDSHLNSEEKGYIANQTKESKVNKQDMYQQGEGILKAHQIDIEHTNKLKTSKDRPYTKDKPMNDAIEEKYDSIDNISEHVDPEDKLNPLSCNKDKSTKEYTILNKNNIIDHRERADALGQEQGNKHYIEKKSSPKHQMIIRINMQEKKDRKTIIIGNKEEDLSPILFKQRDNMELNNDGLLKEFIIREGKGDLDIIRQGKDIHNNSMVKSTDSEYINDLIDEIKENSPTHAQNDKAPLNESSSNDKESLQKHKSTKPVQLSNKILSIVKHNVNNDSQSTKLQPLKVDWYKFKTKGEVTIKGNAPKLKHDKDKDDDLSTEKIQTEPNLVRSNVTDKIHQTKKMPNEPNQDPERKNINSKTQLETTNKIKSISITSDISKFKNKEKEAMKVISKDKLKEEKKESEANIKDDSLDERNEEIASPDVNKNTSGNNTIHSIRNQKFKQSYYSIQTGNNIASNDIKYNKPKTQNVSLNKTGKSSSSNNSNQDFTFSSKDHLKRRSQKNVLHRQMQTNENHSIDIHNPNKAGKTFFQNYQDTLTYSTKGEARDKPKSIKAIKDVSNTLSQREVQINTEGKLKTPTASISGKRAKANDKVAQSNDGSEEDDKTSQQNENKDNDDVKQVGGKERRKEKKIMMTSISKEEECQLETVNEDEHSMEKIITSTGKMKHIKASEDSSYKKAELEPKELDSASLSRDITALPLDKVKLIQSTSTEKKTSDFSLTKVKEKQDKGIIKLEDTVTNNENERYENYNLNSNEKYRITTNKTQELACLINQSSNNNPKSNKADPVIIKLKSKDELLSILKQEDLPQEESVYYLIEGEDNLTDIQEDEEYQLENNSERRRSSHMVKVKNKQVISITSGNQIREDSPHDNRPEHLHNQPVHLFQEGVSNTATANKQNCELNSNEENKFLPKYKSSQLLNAGNKKSIIAGIKTNFVPSLNLNQASYKRVDQMTTWINPSLSSLHSEKANTSNKKPSLNDNASHNNKDHLNKKIDSPKYYKPHTQYKKSKTGVNSASMTQRNKKTHFIDKAKRQHSIITDEKDSNLNVFKTLTNIENYPNIKEQQSATSNPIQQQQQPQSQSSTANHSKKTATTTSQSKPIALKPNQNKAHTLVSPQNTKNRKTAEKIITNSASKGNQINYINNPPNYQTPSFPQSNRQIKSMKNDHNLKSNEKTKEQQRMLELRLSLAKEEEDIAYDLLKGKYIDFLGKVYGKTEHLIDEGTADEEFLRDLAKNQVPIEENNLESIKCSTDMREFIIHSLENFKLMQVKEKLEMMKEKAESNNNFEVAKSNLLGLIALDDEDEFKDKSNMLEPIELDKSWISMNFRKSFVDSLKNTSNENIVQDIGLKTVKAVNISLFQNEK